MVCALYKKGDISTVSNYRSISLLSCKENVAERVVFKHLYNHLHEKVFSLIYSLAYFQTIPQKTNSLIYIMHDLML